ncbi:hypothetical protein AB0H76_13680 [Nocardia sp. NPDC050712]|uniref:LVIVD repeat-containing protein n=1 Tax=Nocardia sp. NPDC050712 TaxID=3155518 RepID=UPI0033F5291A
MLLSNPAPHARRSRPGWAQRSIILTGVVALPLLGLPSGGSLWAAPHSATDVHEFSTVHRTAASRADCGPGSLPETGLQGDVPAADRENGRSKQGYRCNLSLVGSYATRGGGITSTTFEHCSYTGSLFPGALVSDDPGVQVIDAADPARPRRTATLAEPAMRAGTWESLKVNTARKLLAGTAVPVAHGTGYLSIYDISDCAHPRLLNPGPGTDLAMPLGITTHEGGFSPDGRTYWSASPINGNFNAVDVSDPTQPRVVWEGNNGGRGAHGFGISRDGNRLYLSTGGGVTVYDISAVQRHDPNPVVHQVSRISWQDGTNTQHSVPVDYNGTPYLFTVDESSSGGVKLIDLTEETAPQVVNTIKLEINLPQHLDSGYASSMGGSVFAYEAHYCAADRATNPTALACGWISSGVRVFDVRDPFHIREIAYFNPPAQTARNTDLFNSPHALISVIGTPALSQPAIDRAKRDGDWTEAEAQGPRADLTAFGDLSTDWCFSPPEWHGTQLWTTCADNGFLVLQLDNGVYTPPADQAGTIGQS